MLSFHTTIFWLFIFPDFIRPICLPPPEETVRVGENVTVAGWGKTEQGTSSQIKQKVVVPIFDRNICTQQFAKYGLEIVESQICAGGEKHRDACSGQWNITLLYSQLSLNILIFTIIHLNNRWYIY